MVDVEKIWLTEDAVHIRLSDGREAEERFADYPRLKYATPEQRGEYVADKYGLHWRGLDEDLEFESFFHKKQITELRAIFTDHPELNASAVARRLGIPQSLLAQYISGVKTPSTSRLNEIIDCLHQIGKELMEIPVIPAPGHPRRGGREGGVDAQTLRGREADGKGE